jgi:hypothetical protein
MTIKKFIKPAMLATIATLLLSLPLESQAQQRERGERGERPQRGEGFDPAQMQQRMMERMREQLEVKDDAEWKVLQPRLERLMAARRDAGTGVGMGMGAMMGRQGGPGGQQGGPGAQGARGGFGAQASPAAQELQKALDSNASNEQIKKALAKFDNERETRRAELQKAQEELKKLLSAKQEARLKLNGLL